MKILVINGGSSSFKYQLLEMDNESVLAKGLAERIGQAQSKITHEYWENGVKQKVSKEIHFPNHEAAFKEMANYLTDEKVGVIKNTNEIKYIGHRVVHGGEKFSTSQKITPEMMEELRALIPLAPLHNPANIAGIEAAEKTFSNAENFAIFDTSFHQTLPEKAFRYAIPNHFYTEDQVRVYGFHGISHKYVDGRTRRYFNNPHLKNITIHLGNGASMAAINEHGACIDTSMGLTPLDGLIMGTRSGQIDASVVFFLGQELGMSYEEVKTLLNKKSGMLGLTGHSDARDVAALYNSGDANAALCYEMYGYRIQKFIGAYTAALNGLDSIVFTAGLGENDALTRLFACKNLDFFGIKLDEKKNVDLNHAEEPVEIQRADSRVKILIIPTNEEWQIVKEIVGFVK